MSTPPPPPPSMYGNIVRPEFLQRVEGIIVIAAGSIGVTAVRRRRLPLEQVGLGMLISVVASL